MVRIIEGKWVSCQAVFFAISWPSKWSRSYKIHQDIYSKKSLPSWLPKWLFPLQQSSSFSWSKSFAKWQYSSLWLEWPEFSPTNFHPAVPLAMLQYYELNVLTWALPSIGVECIIRVTLYIYLNYSIDKFSTIDIVIVPGLQNPLISVTKDEEDSVDVLYKFATDKKFSFNLRQARPQLLCLHSLQKTPTWYSKWCYNV